MEWPTTAWEHTEEVKIPELLHKKSALRPTLRSWTLFVFLTTHNRITFSSQNFTQAHFYTMVIKNILRTGTYSTDTGILLLEKHAAGATAE